ESAQRSFGGRSSIRADRRVRARPETCDARAREVARGRFEVATFDPIDRVQHDVATALEIAGLQHLLAVLLEAGRPADGEDVLPHRPPDPVLRVPQRKESRLEAERFALVVDAVLACQLVT